MSVSVNAGQLIELTADLKRSKGAVGAKVAAAVRKTAHDIEADAKVLAPYEFGNLRNSIGTSITGSGSFGTMTAEVGPTAEYGIYQEYGTSKMAPQPFLGPAFDRRLPGFEAAMAKLASDIL